LVAVSEGLEVWRGPYGDRRGLAATMRDPADLDLGG
jgi:hypothetical protein